MGLPSTVKQMFPNSTLQECECIEGEAPSCSQVAAILEQKAILRREVDDLTIFVATKEAEVANLKSELMKVISKGPGRTQNIRVR